MKRKATLLALTICLVPLSAMAAIQHKVPPIKPSVIYHGLVYNHCLAPSQAAQIANILAKKPSPYLHNRPVLAMRGNQVAYVCWAPRWQHLPHVPLGK